MANQRNFLETLVSGSQEHKWNGISPDCVALIFVRSPEGDERSNLGQQALVCNSYPITGTDANEYNERFYEPAWKYVGHVFSYPHPEGGTQFKTHPDAEFGHEKWDQMLKAPVLGTGITYWEKIMCRMTEMSYDEYLALKRKAELSSRESGTEVAQVSEAASMPRLKQIAGLRSTQQMGESTMKGEMPNRPKHNCPKPGSPWLGFAPLDFSIRKLLVDRDASTEEVSAQLSAWITADLAKHPHPTEHEAKRFQAALLANVPFVVYCGSCLTTLCVVHPEQIDVATEMPAVGHHAGLEKAGRFGIVAWTDRDIVEGLQNAGADPTPNNITAVRERVHVQHIADQMIEAGWAVIEEAIKELGLATGDVRRKEGA